MSFEWFKRKPLTSMVAIATIASAIAAGFSAYSTSVYTNSSRESEKRQILQSYLTMYADVVSKIDGEVMSSVAGFTGADRKSQAIIEILGGMLVTVVDAMYETGDGRASAWVEFIEKIPGPLVKPGFCLENFAKTDQTMLKIEKARENVMKKAYVKENIWYACKHH